MGLREKVANKIKSKSSGGGNDAPMKVKSKKTSSGGGLFTTLLLIALLGVGGFIAWQLMQLNTRLSGGMPDMSAGFLPTSGSSNSSYEYAVDFIFDSNLSGRMAQRGKDGWQVVGSRRTQDSITGQLGYEFIFMRKAK